MAILAVKHNIEIAHRLILTEGKCQQIHGHSMWVTMYLEGAIDSAGMADGMDFADLKTEFRTYLDGTYDHHLLLNKNDAWAQSLPVQNHNGQEVWSWLPGLVPFDGDPTTENIAKDIYSKFFLTLPVVRVEVWETAVNMASYGG
jgi:6-pyruvoyl-tetrahydropterin synthase